MFPNDLGFQADLQTDFRIQIVSIRAPSADVPQKRRRSLHGGCCRAVSDGRATDSVKFHQRVDNDRCLGVDDSACTSSILEMARIWHRRIQGSRGRAPNHQRFFYKVRFLMSFQIFLDSIIDSSNETITFIMPCILCSFIRSLDSQ